MFDENDILIFGDHHRSRPQHTTVARVIKHLVSKSKDFVVYLEIPTSAQEKMNSVIFGGREYTEVFWNHTILRDYGYETIVNTCKRYQIPVVCFDKGQENRNFDDREKQMAEMLFNENRKVITMVGAHHLPKSKHPHLYQNKDVKYIQMWDTFRAGWEKFERILSNISAQGSLRTNPLLLESDCKNDHDYNLVIPYDQNLLIPCECI